MERIYDVAIIGGGVVGAAVARELSRYRLDCVLLEKGEDVAAGASKANSALVHAGFDAETGTAKARFNVEGNRLMEGLCRELGVKFRRCGAYVVGFAPEDGATLAALKARGEANGVEGLTLLTGDELRRREKNLSPEIACALFAPSAAITCPYELTVALAGNAMDNGCALLSEFCVKSVSLKGELFELADGEKSVLTRYAVNAAGLYAGEAAALFGDGGIKITPRKGQYMLLDKTAGGFVSATVFPLPTALGKGILITPTVDGNLLVGPTSEPVCDCEDSAVSREGQEKVAEGVKKIAPDIPLNKAITAFAGNRAAGSTGDFILRTGKSGRVVHLAGIESPGLTASPALAKEAVRLLEQCGLKLQPNPDFNPYRKADGFFWYLSDDEKNKLIKKDPSYGRIVCRCESVTEGEIIHAVRANPPARSIDAVKRRTRSGMGRCQGGFCSPFVAEVIARETGRDILQVTKSGGQSHLNLSRTKGGEDKGGAQADKKRAAAKRPYANAKEGGHDKA